MKAGKRAIDLLGAIPALCHPRYGAVHQSSSGNTSVQLEHYVDKVLIDGDLGPSEVAKSSGRDKLGTGIEWPTKGALHASA